MIYLGKEQEVNGAKKRKVEYIRCDNCGKKIIPYDWKLPNEKDGEYCRVHVWKYGVDVYHYEYDQYKQYCKKCAKNVVEEYIEYEDRGAELELAHSLLGNEEFTDANPISFNGYSLVEYDNNP